MNNRVSKPAPGEMVVLTRIPAGLLDGLPQEDQDAIVAIVGKPVLLVDYDEDGRAELHFEDPFDARSSGYSHTPDRRIREGRQTGPYYCRMNSWAYFTTSSPFMVG